jgi:hypothetical protein
LENFELRVVLLKKEPFLAQSEQLLIRGHKRLSISGVISTVNP